MPAFNFSVPASSTNSLAFRLAHRQALWQCPPARSRSVPTRRAWRVRFFEVFSCRSSVVEHSLGKGEVESSIPSGSTILKAQKFREVRDATPSRPEVRRIKGSNLINRDSYWGLVRRSPGCAAIDTRPVVKINTNIRVAPGLTCPDWDKPGRRPIECRPWPALLARRGAWMLDRIY